MTLNINTDWLDQTLREEVFELYRDGTVPLDEQGVGFLLGYHYTGKGRDIAYEIGQFGSSETSFSPDLDLLVVGDPLIGFELKGIRTNNVATTKQQLYEGLGQAVALLSQPITGAGGALEHVCLACPFPNADGVEEEWYNQFIEAVKTTPIGLVDVGRGGLEWIVEPDQNPNYNPDLHERVVTELRTESGSVRDPRRAFEIRAFEIAEDHIDTSFPERM